jgi:protein ImuA
VQAREAAAETGLVYAPGLQALGLDPDRVGLVEVRTEAEALRVVDEALRSGAVAAVLAELGHAPRLDLSVTRRFNLSARRTKALALMLTRDLDATSAALTRWRVAPASSRDRRRRLGRPAFRLSLNRNRLGPTGEWILEWDRDDRLFRPAPPLSAPLARPAVDRPDAARPAGPAEPAGPYRQAG